MKRYNVILVSLLCLFAVLPAQSKNNYDTFAVADVVGFDGSVKYGDDFEVLFGGGKKLNDVVVMFVYDKMMNIFRFGIYPDGDVKHALLEVSAKFSDIKLNIGDEDYYRGITLESNGETYRIFTASGKYGPEIRVGNKDQISYMFELNCVEVYNSMNLEEPLESGCDTFLDFSLDGTYLFNDWMKYIRMLVEGR